ncbi:fungal-specific transcription factor domain-containing protein [Talaromyces proteolyticus]|uniref:Fungal-specific transcription factor domain-containing protein n=1 Tax=Talaromyces proteolyticus TaxID=1131652 RepID=A0AAD4KVX1_9EURO|nr:fungal-specific transcription factor domain-containing protein [Talaromyces proteolyticus]KAH8697960.1 fungal-specific transcription factor domain-containing protein [Talaromyces proteolyticus]
MPHSGIKRVRGACSTCRHRKIRCDAAILNGPCTNCRRNGLLCDPAKAPKSDLPKGSSSISLAADLTPHICAIQASRGRGHQPFTNYRFIATPKVQGLCPEDMVCLKAQKSLYLPNPSILESFLHHYFLYVHPSMPVVDEAQFWGIYQQDEEQPSSTQQISLLLLQAMLFAASSYIPIELSRSLGYDSIAATRKSLYRSAKALYDFDTESNSVDIARSALLLTYHNSSVNQLTNSTWLSIAILHARTINAHTYATQNQTRSQVYTLKRIWWSCIVRDRIVAIGMRRPLQITKEQFDSSQTIIQHTDFEEELCRSKVYDKQTKQKLCDIFIAQCQLAVAMTDSVSILYPPFKNKSTLSIDDINQELAMCVHSINSLKIWELSYLMPIEESLVNAHATVKLYTHLTSLYHQSTRVALCHYMAPLLFLRHESRWYTSYIISINQIKSELVDAVATVTAKVREVCTACNVSKGQLPLSILMNTILPAFLLRLNMQLCSSTPSFYGEYPSSISPYSYEDNQSLKCYLQIIDTCNVRYDTSYIAHWFDQLLRMATAVKVRMLAVQKRFPEQLPRLTGSFIDLLEYQPMTYLSLATAIDGLFATANVTIETAQVLSTFQRGVILESEHQIMISNDPTNYELPNSRSELSTRVSSNKEGDFDVAQKQDYIQLVQDLPILGG